MLLFTARCHRVTEFAECKKTISRAAGIVATCETTRSHLRGDGRPAGRFKVGVFY